MNSLLICLVHCCLLFGGILQSQEPVAQTAAPVPAVPAALPVATQAPAITVKSSGAPAAPPVSVTTTATVKPGDTVATVKTITAPVAPAGIAVTTPPIPNQTTVTTTVTTHPADLQPKEILNAEAAPVVKQASVKKPSVAARDKLAKRAPASPKAPTVSARPPDKRLRDAQTRKRTLQAVLDEKPRTLPVTGSKKKPARKRRHQKEILPAQLIDFTFDNANLTDAVNRIAEAKKFTVIFPQGEQAITQKINFKPDKLLTMDQAENYLDSFLRLAGYSKRLKDSFLIIQRIDGNLPREPLTWFFNPIPAELPVSDQPIKIIYYLSNIKVPQNIQSNEPLNLLLRDMLSPAPASNYLYDPQSNGVIITDKASTLNSVLTLLRDLDGAGSKDAVEVAPLYNTSSGMVASLLRDKLLAIQGDGRARADIRTGAALYFAPNTRVVSDDRNNSLIIMGNESAVIRLKEFVEEYMDAPIDSGRSILHIYDLKYLDAGDLAQTLTAVVAGTGSPNGQSTRERSGPERYFDGVIIRAETYQPIQPAQTVPGGAAPTADTGTVYRGGNRLIIAARQADWERLKSLLDELDRPRRQVIIEVMIVDLSLDTNKLIASQLRNPVSCNLPEGFNFQSAQIVGPILDVNPPVTPQTLASDLLTLLGNDPAVAHSIAFDQTLGINNGSLIISFKDPSTDRIALLFQILDRFRDVKILSHPFLVTLDNVQAQESVKQIRRRAGDATQGENGGIIANLVDVEAELRVNVTPRISSIDRLNLQITVDINQFTEQDGPGVSISPEGGNRVTRKIYTSANLGSGQVLVLGGLTRLEDNDVETKTPILGDIPILGWFFKKTQKRTFKNELAVFICPTIVEPKLRLGQYQYTHDTIVKMYQGLGDDMLFANMRDPVNRLFFSQDAFENQELIDEYLAEQAPESFKEADLASKANQIERIRDCNKLACEDPLENRSCSGLDAEQLRRTLAELENPLVEFKFKSS